jgi:hypothetical protein
MDLGLLISLLYLIHLADLSIENISLYMSLLCTVPRKKFILNKSIKITIVKRYYPLPPIALSGLVCKARSSIYENIFNALVRKGLADYSLNSNCRAVFYVTKQGIVTKQEPKAVEILLPHQEKDFYSNYGAVKASVIFNEKGFQLLYPITKFPTKGDGIVGACTLSKGDRSDMLINNNDLSVNSKMGGIFARYMVTMYGGEPLRDVRDILARVDQLFTYDDWAKGSFAHMQHFLSVDTYNFTLPTKEVHLPSNYNVPKKITLQHYLEIDCIKDSHPSLGKEGKYELIFIDKTNPAHQLIVAQNAKLFKTLCQQPIPEAAGFSSAIGIDKKALFAIDVKYIGEPEVNLPMLSSFSSRSPAYEIKAIANKMYGQLDQKIKALQIEEDIINVYHEELYRIKTDFKNKKVSLENFSQSYEQWQMDFFKQQIYSGNTLTENLSFLPSIIARPKAIDMDNAYHKMKLYDPVRLKYLIAKATKIELIKFFPEMQDYHKYNHYDIQLLCMIYAQEAELLDNYYRFRKILDLDDK